MVDPTFLPPLPFDADANDVSPDQHRAVLGVASEAPFLYIGKALTLPQFADYIEAYNFGSIPPEWVVLHHTAIPAASWAPYGDPAQYWDVGEQGLGEQSIQDKRRRRLDGIMRYYRDTLGWDRGPHLFIDERWIWLFTPLYEVGIHAASGNSNNLGGQLHYSIGLEAVGYYEHVAWPQAVEQLVGGAVALLQRKLKTFDISYKVGPGGMCAHRDYNKPACPGAKITPAYYIGVVQRAADALNSPIPIPPVPPQPPEPVGRYTADSLLLGVVSANPQAIADYIVKRGTALDKPQRYVRYDVGAIVDRYIEVCSQAGLNAHLVIAQMIHETGWLTSWWCARDRRNGCGYGVNGRKLVRDPAGEKPPASAGEDWAYNTEEERRRWEMGLSFADWKTSSKAHAGRLLRYALGPNEGTPLQRGLMQEALAWRALTGVLWGTVDMIKELGGAHNSANIGVPRDKWVGWAVPGDAYGAAIAAVANAIVAAGG